MTHAMRASKFFSQFIFWCSCEEWCMLPWPETTVGQIQESFDVHKKAWDAKEQENQDIAVAV